MVSSKVEKQELGLIPRGFLVFFACLGADPVAGIPWDWRGLAQIKTHLIGSQNDIILYNIGCMRFGLVHKSMIILNSSFTVKYV